ncbi:hypothetical protein [Citricoccus sp. GCM10030269]|uniref:hypothetical protein n=1 Tax=Citricoccus sp. GCM10030269 TaxID=3273388 RepID=UPI00361DFB0A
MLMELMTTAANVYGVIPNPQPEQPPGTEGIMTLLNWVSWIVIILGVVGFLASAGSLVFAAFTGREIQGIKGLAIAIIVCMLAVGSGAIMRVFV